MTSEITRRQADLIRQSTELAWAAPQVVAHRVSRMMLAGATPDARDQREFQRMGAEKVAAFQESWVTMAARSVAWQQQWAMQAMQLWWQVAVGAAWLRPRALQQRMRHDALSAWTSTLDVASHGLRPVRRRAVANSRRLAKTPLRRLPD